LGDSVLSLNRIGWLIRSISKLPDREISMKKMLLGAVALIAIGAAPALAADLPAAPVYTKAPAVAPVPVYNWTGFYVGGNVGGAWGDRSNDGFAGNAATAPLFAEAIFPTSLGVQPSGVIGGAQIGYNWQVSPMSVWGIEADIQGSGYNGSAVLTSTPPIAAQFNTAIEQHSNWFGTVRGRAGFLATPNLLLYGTGGLAYGQTEVSSTTVGTGFTLATCPLNFTCATGASTSTRAGWTVGAGAEWIFAPGWSAKAEYLYIDLGTQSTNLPSVILPAFVFSASAPFRENIARVGINYHFGGPVIARY
jgi:outer membrane immunogenic protein